MSETTKTVLRHIVALLILTLGITIAVKVFDQMYDYRIVLGILTGRYLVDPALRLAGKIKPLQ
jgi:hypothetical protein